MLVDENKFLFEQNSENWFEDNLYVQCCKFSPNNYSDNLFSRFGVEFPKHLENAVKKRRAEYLAGRYCAMKAMCSFGKENYQINTGKGREPLWPEGLLGSISHTSNFAIAVVSNDLNSIGIGIDIEEVVPIETMNIIRSQILNEEEEDLILSQAHIDADKLFTLFFSVKECFFKAAYPIVGRYFGFDVVTVKGFSEENAKIDLQLNISLGQELTQYKSFEASFRSIDSVHFLTFLNIPR